jgi:hypothetical protein
MPHRTRGKPQLTPRRMILIKLSCVERHTNEELLRSVPCALGSVELLPCRRSAHASLIHLATSRWGTLLMQCNVSCIARSSLCMHMYVCMGYVIRTLCNGDATWHRHHTMNSVTCASIRPGSILYLSRPASHLASTIFWWVWVLGLRKLAPKASYSICGAAANPQPPSLHFTNQILQTYFCMHESSTP